MRIDLEKSKLLRMGLQAADLLHNASTGQHRISKPLEELDVRTLQMLVCEMDMLNDALFDTQMTYGLPDEHLVCQIHWMVDGMIEELNRCIQNNGLDPHALFEDEALLIRQYVFDDAAKEDTQ